MPVQQLQCMPVWQLNPLGGAKGAVWARNAPDLTICYADSIGTHLRAKVQPHAPRLLDAACAQAFCNSLAEANVAISLAATGECSSCQCLSASALLVVFPVACPYSSLFVTVFHSRHIVVCMYRVWQRVAKQSSRTVVNCLWGLGSIQERVRVPHRKHVVNELKHQVVNMHLCLSAISLTTCRLDDIYKEVLHYFPDLFYVVCTYSP